MYHSSAVLLLYRLPTVVYELASVSIVNNLLTCLKQYLSEWFQKRFLSRN
jgi:hypothetical protein